MIVKQEFFGFSPTMWMGVVEDIDDPLKLGRARVRIFGWHTQAADAGTEGSGTGGGVEGSEGEIVPVTNLPWAHVMHPVNSGPNSGVGGPVTGIVRGTWVVGMFLDGEIGREPMVLGSIPGIPMEYSQGPQKGFYDPKQVYPRKTQSWDIEEPDTNRLARNDNVDVHGDPKSYPHAVIEKKKQNQFKSESGNGYEWAEPVLDGWKEFRSKYPHNKVLETTSGHIFEIDDTPQFERIHVYHKNGSYIEMGGAAGPANRIDKVTGDQFTLIDRNHYKTVGGDIHVSGRHMTNLSKTFLVTGDQITFKAQGGVTVAGKLTADSMSVLDGATDSFTVIGGRVVTVKDGIIISVSAG